MNVSTPCRQSIILYTCLLAYKGRQNFHNWPVISWRIASNPFQGIDTTKTDLKLVTTELLNCPSKTLRDLSFLGNLQGLSCSTQLSPCKKKSNEDNNPSHDLSNRRTHLVFKVKAIFQRKSWP